MPNQNVIFNRVTGLKFLYDNFPYYFNKNRIEMFFVESLEELLCLKIPYNNYDTMLLKRSANQEKCFISDIKCKDNRFFTNLNELKEAIKDLEDKFIYCVEAHKFRTNENYYSDKLAIVQFSTSSTFEQEIYTDKVSFIPSIVPGVSTRDNSPYMIIDYPYLYGNLFKVLKLNPEMIRKQNLSDYNISHLAGEIHRLINAIRDYLVEINHKDTFQLIVRIDANLNLLPIDFRTPNAWANSKQLIMRRQ